MSILDANAQFSDRNLAGVPDDYRFTGVDPEDDAFTYVSIDTEVRNREGHVEIRDITAMAIARDLNVRPTEFPELHRLATEGYAHKARLNTELGDLYGVAETPRQRARLNMMFTWAIHGGLND
jgi:hypothetical protein